MAQLAAGTTIDGVLAATLDDIPSLTMVLPTNFITGLEISHGSDTDHDIIVSLGKARDVSDTDDMVLSSAITKQADASWSVGTNAGGMAAGESLPTSGTIHLWLIKRSDTGVVDAMFNNHATSGLTPTLPTGYDYKRRIWSFRTDASANIILGDQVGTGLNRAWIYDSPIKDISANNPGTSAVMATLSVPAGLSVMAKTRGYASNSGGGSYPIIYLSSPDSTDLAPSTTVSPFNDANAGGGSYQQSYNKAVKTNTSSQIRYRISASAAENTIYIFTDGWEDSLL